MKTIDAPKIEIKRLPDTEKHGSPIGHAECNGHEWQWEIFDGTMTIWLDSNQAYRFDYILTDQQIMDLIQATEIGFVLGAAEGRHEEKSRMRQLLGL